jgi:streptogramin lyase
MLRTRSFLTMVFVLLGLTLTLSLAAVALASLPVSETPLSSTGQAYEVNPDPQGALWISDYGAQEIRSYDPISSSYTIYPVGGRPSDAHSDGAGNLWWADFGSNMVGRFPIAGGSASLWEIPGSTGLYGTGLGANSDFWVTDANLSYLYHLTPSTSEVCTYTLPLDGFSDYLVVSGSQVWLGDWWNNQIDRLDTDADTFTWWSLPVGSRPTGMALDDVGKLWWADPTQGNLGSLDPASNQVITYTQSIVHYPQMLTLVDGLVWYSDQDQVGILNPALDHGISITITPQSASATPKCSTLAQPTTTTITPTQGQVAWADVTYPSLSSPIGWQVFQLPQNASAWGIAAQGDNIWLVDQGRHVLARLPKQTEAKVYLPLIIK